MDKSFLLKKISDPIGKKEVVCLAEKSADSIVSLINLSLNHHYEIAFRAAWILEITADIYPGHFNKHIKEFIDAYMALENQSCRRHFTKIMMSLTDKLSQDRLLSDINPEAIIEPTFEWMIDPQTPVAVRVNCMDILYNLRSKSDWIADELRAQIEFQLKNGSAALQSRGKKVLYKLYRSQRKS